MSLISDIQNIIDPGNPNAQTARLNAEANLEAVKLAQIQAAQASQTPSWVVPTIIGGFVVIVVVVVLVLRKKKKS